MDVVTLYRPVGPAELRLIEASGFRAFPPRLPEQPIFYPVCNEAYAVEIAERWNARDDGGGFVTCFDVRAEHIAIYERHIVGSRVHEEYWIPAEDLDAFNGAIVGTIRVIRAFPPTSLSADERRTWLSEYAPLLEFRSVVEGPEGPLADGERRRGEA